MARANNGGWDFIKPGMIVEYKEDSFIFVVEVLEDTSDAEWYRFKIRPLAANTNIEKEPFTITFRKDINGVYSGQSQFYKNAEYIPLPIGAKWPFIFDQEKLSGTEFEGFKPGEI